MSPPLPPRPSPRNLARFGVVVLLLLVPASVLEANRDASPASGEVLYRTACAACHGANGRGAPASLRGFDDPLPDFTDSSFLQESLEEFGQLVRVRQAVADEEHSEIVGIRRSW